MTQQSAPLPSTTSLSTQQMGAVTVTMIFISSFHYIFGRMLAPHFSPFVSSFYIMVVAVIEIFVYLLFKRAVDFSILRKHFAFFASIGFLLSMATVFSYAAVQYIDAGSAGLLSRFSTVFTLLLSYFWLHEALSRSELLGAVICTAGAIVISFQPSNIFRLGSLLLIAGVFCYALHIAIVKRYGEGIEFGNFFLFRVGMTTFFLLIFMLVTGNFVSPGNINNPPGFPAADATFFSRTGLLILTATVDVVVSRVIYYWALRQMRLGIHTIALTVTPLITIAWSVIIFAESPSPQALVGGSIVLAGILLVVTTQQRSKVAAK